MFEQEIDDQAIADGAHELETLEGALGSALVGVAVSDRCKVDGCENRYVQQLGPYGRLCEEHAAERKADPARLNGRPKAVPEPEPTATSVLGSSAEDDARQVFEHALELREAVRKLEQEIDRARNDLADVLDELGRVVQA